MLAVVCCTILPLPLPDRRAALGSSVYGRVNKAAAIFYFCLRTTSYTTIATTYEHGGKRETGNGNRKQQSRVMCNVSRKIIKKMAEIAIATFFPIEVTIKFFIIYNCNTKISSIRFLDKKLIL